MTSSSKYQIMYYVFLNRRLKLVRKREQEVNVKRKEREKERRRLVNGLCSQTVHITVCYRKEEHIRQGITTLVEEERDSDGDDDAEYYRQEVGVAPDPGIQYCVIVFHMGLELSLV